MNSIHSRSDTEAGFYPLFLNVSGRLCVVVGGGSVAERKARTLLSFGADVLVVSPAVTKRLDALIRTGALRWAARPYRRGDLEGAALVFATTDDGPTNIAVRAEASERGVPVNVADNPALCDFYVPSMVRKGPIVIAISTSGTLPLLAKRLRKEIEGAVTAKHLRYARSVAAIRRRLMAREPDRKRRRAIMMRLASLSLDEVASSSPATLLRKVSAPRR